MEKMNTSNYDIVDITDRDRKIGSGYVSVSEILSTFISTRHTMTKIKKCYGIFLNRRKKYVIKDVHIFIAGGHEVDKEIVRVNNKISKKLGY